MLGEHLSRSGNSTGPKRNPERFDLEAAALAGGEHNVLDANDLEVSFQKLAATAK